ncbi:hypothetical protein R3P38DRAFT_3190750 [Favolaschia claudopus]|uniref:Uncharacterized protein n=1 Tax=Favolaschia claudopus TaxID=2862362 RepID=A0AAW0BMB4_9AGAR
MSTTTESSDSEAPPSATTTEFSGSEASVPHSTSTESSSGFEDLLPFAPRDSSPFNAYPHDDLKKALFFDMTTSTAIGGLPKNQKNHIFRTLRQRFLESGHPESPEAGSNAEVKAHILHMYALGCRIFSDKHADANEAREELARSQQFDDVWEDDSAGDDTSDDTSDDAASFDKPRMLFWSGAECAVADDGESDATKPQAGAADTNEAVMGVVDAADAQDVRAATAQAWNAWSSATALELFDYVPPYIRHGSETVGEWEEPVDIDDGKHALRLMCVLGWRDVRCGCVDGLHHEWDTSQTYAFQSAEGTVMVMREKSVVLPLN